MSEKKRTPKQIAEIIEKTVNEIIETGGGEITNDLIKNTCKKYKISEPHIRKVMGWSINIIKRRNEPIRNTRNVGQN